MSKIEGTTSTCCCSTSLIRHLFSMTCSRCLSGNTMETQSKWATGSSIPGPARKAVPWSTSSVTAWRGSSPSRTWRSGPSTRSESRPSMALVQGLGARRSGGEPGSPVSIHSETIRGLKEYPDSHISVLCLPVGHSTLLRTHKCVSLCHHLQQHPGPMGGGS